MASKEALSASTIPIPSTPPTWACLLLGVVLIGAGLLVLGDVVFFTVISTIFIGAMAIVAGIVELFHAFSARGWGGFVWQIVLGLLYGAFGIVLLSQPVSGALILTYALALFLAASGIVRVFLSFRHWRSSGWIMLLSGAVGILAGLVILTQWPYSGLWILGFVLGIDLILHGIAWLFYAWRPGARTA